MDSSGCTSIPGRATLGSQPRRKDRRGNGEGAGRDLSFELAILKSGLRHRGEHCQQNASLFVQSLSGIWAPSIWGIGKCTKFIWQRIVVTKKFGCRTLDLTMSRRKARSTWKVFLSRGPSRQALVLARCSHKIARYRTVNGDNDCGSFEVLVLSGVSPTECTEHFGDNTMTVDKLINSMTC